MLLLSCHVHPDFGSTVWYYRSFLMLFFHPLSFSLSSRICFPPSSEPSYYFNYYFVPLMHFIVVITMFPSLSHCLLFSVFFQKPIRQYTFSISHRTIFQACTPSYLHIYAGLNKWTRCLPYSCNLPFLYFKCSMKVVAGVKLFFSVPCQVLFSPFCYYSSSFSSSFLDSETSYEWYEEQERRACCLSGFLLSCLFLYSLIPDLAGFSNNGTCGLMKASGSLFLFLSFPTYHLSPINLCGCVA